MGDRRRRATPAISVGQAFEDSEKILVDFTDDGVSSIVASLRLFKASEGDDYVTGGTLRVTGSRCLGGDLLGAVTPTPCASTSSISICRRTGSRCARPSRATRRGCWWSGRAPAFEDRHVRDLPDLLEPGDLLVFNDTKVIPAQLSGMRRRGDAVAQIDATLHHAHRAGSLEGVRQARPSALAVGDRISFGHDGNACFLGKLEATVAEKGEGGEVTLAFDLSGAFLDEALQAVGHMPLPPYIASKRPDDERDRADYQTIYAREEGAVAAPTAGLHFTPELFAALDRRGIERALRDAACRGRHVPAGQGRRHGRAQDAWRKRHDLRRDGRSGERGARAAATASSRSARRRCGCSKARRRPTAGSRHGPARPTSSSRPATASGPSMR